MMAVARSLALLFVFFLVPTVQAGAGKSGMLIPEIQVYEEIDKQVDPLLYEDDAALSAAFPFQRQQINSNKGYAVNPHWVLIPLKGVQFSRFTPWWLELNYPLLDFVDVYFLQPGAGWKLAGKTGDMRPWSTRQRYGPMFYFAIPEGGTHALVRLQTMGSLQFPFVIYREDVLNQALFDESMFHGLFFGALTIMIFYNLFVYLMARDESYLYYVILITAITLFEFTILGYGSMYFWRDDPGLLNSQVQTITVGLCLTFVVLFTRSILDISRLSRTLDRILLTQCVISGLMAVVGTFVAFTWMVRFTATWPLVVVLTVIISGVVAVARQQPGAGIFVAAWGAGLVGALLFSAQQQGWIEANEITTNSLKFGIILNVVLLSFSMASHIRKLRREKESYEQEARVNYGLALIDSLTGVPNRRAFDDRLEQEIERCKRDSHPISLMMIDIDYFKNFNDAYGHQQGDDTLVRTALIMRNCLRRPSDGLFRYGGEEFSVVLPDTGEAGARHTAERVMVAIRKLSIPHEESPFKQVTVSIGVAVCKTASIEAEDFIQIADQALYEAKRKGRNTLVLTEQRDSPIVNIGDYFKNTPKDTL